MTTQPPDTTKQPIPVWAKVMPVLWTILLVPWFPFIMADGMAYEGGDYWWVDVFVCAHLTYPLSVVIAWLFRRRIPALVFLPALNIILWFVTGSMTDGR